MPDGTPGSITAADVADFLEKGLLDVLVDLFRSSPGLTALLADLLADERISVRLGASALVEEFAALDPGGLGAAAAGAILPLLGDPRPVVRGDAAYLLGVAGDASMSAPLDRMAETDGNADAREIAAEAAERIRARGTPSGR